MERKNFADSAVFREILCETSGEQENLQFWIAELSRKPFVLMKSVDTMQKT